MRFRVEIWRDGVGLIQQLGALQPRQLEGADIVCPVIVADDVNGRGHRLQGIGGDGALAQLAAARRTVGDPDFTATAPAFGNGLQDGNLGRVGTISFYTIGGALQVCAGDIRQGGSQAA